MYYTEKVCDIFDGDGGARVYAQCVSADFAMGKGIAVEFNAKFDCRNELLKMYRNTLSGVWRPSGPCIRFVRAGRVYCLVTKDRYWQKPTVGTLVLALESMRKDLRELADKSLEEGRRLTLVIPPLGCGLDRLDYAQVKQLVMASFADMDLDIECRTNSERFAEEHFWKA